MDEDYQFGVGEWMGHTTVNPVGLAVLIVLGLALVLLPRRLSIVPVLIMASFVAGAQRIVIATLDFDFLRVLILFGWARVMLRGELAGFRWKRIDTLVCCWAVAGTVTFSVLQATGSSFVYRMGWAFNIIGGYFLFRCLVRNWSDVATIAKTFALLSLPVACFFLLEHTTGRNLFATFGGVPEITMIRQGRLRCQGAFAHPILAGCFWAVGLPLVVSLWWTKYRQRWLLVAGTIGCLVIIITCASSVPLGATMAALIGGLAFYVRDRLRLVRWSILGALAALHVMMPRPVWYLFAQLDLAGGSTGWHRYWIIDLAVNNFGDWWLIGARNPSSWQSVFPALDITNQYILEGVQGGLITLVFFVAIIVEAFAGIGRLLPRVTSRRTELALAWGLGVSLFVHVMCFWGVSYFGQINMLWYLSLAMIASLSPARALQPARAVTRARPPAPRRPCSVL